LGPERATACSRTPQPAARFTLLTQKGRTNLGARHGVIRDELKKIGLTVDVVPLDAAAVIDRFLNAGSTRLLQRRQKRIWIRATTVTSGSAPAARTCGTSSRKRRRPTGSARSTS